MRPFSISTTETPNAAAAAATERPPEPAPITQISGLSNSAKHASAPNKSRQAGIRRAGTCCPPRAVAFDGGRNERHQSQRDQAADQLGRSRGLEIEVEAAARLLGRKA